MLTLSVGAESTDARWAGEGLIALSEGRFRFEVGETQPPAEIEVGTVIGLGGEGAENTVSETVGGSIGAAGQRCWMNPHAPVGYFTDTISVEEALRVTGAVVESLRGEIKQARMIDPALDTFEVELMPSATQPEDEFVDRPDRVWGDRWILGRLGGPIAVELTGEGALRSLEFEFGPYEPYSLFGQQHSVDHVSISARFAPADTALELDPPACQAIE
ncbi:hypothetical protein CBI38_09380 [Rhodococcus oxybenzonivorans]|uniref:Uncharacterized protein n=1 Tax=Rhodococcus oxybenzonivorans TaxID=1990687 RepID=A0A2S2BT59_9NOCA|nr:hypothetical protein [Rhodococcus sp. ZPP]AWK71772.1 hypothetical protein CBI38_09380 [Rhodococcus oxybenzonivorans]